MARRLQNQKRSEYHCPAKVCPNPADLRQFPSLMKLVPEEWASRMTGSKNGTARIRRAKAKSLWFGNKAKLIRSNKRGTGR